MNRKDFEIMAPVGSYESLHAAIEAGTDAIYFGVEGLNMRSRSSVNFTLDDLRNIASICDKAGVKTYLTVNTIIYDGELDKMRAVIDAVKESGISAIIASDIAAITYARSIGVEVHISTQLNVTNIEAVRFFARFADVMVLARELNLDQVKSIADAIKRRQPLWANSRGRHTTGRNACRGLSAHAPHSGSCRETTGCRSRGLCQVP